MSQDFFTQRKAAGITETPKFQNGRANACSIAQEPDCKRSKQSHPSPHSPQCSGSSKQGKATVLVCNLVQNDKVPMSWKPPHLCHQGQGDCNRGAEVSLVVILFKAIDPTQER